MLNFQEINDMNLAVIAEFKALNHTLSVVPTNQICYNMFVEEMADLLTGHAGELLNYLKESEEESARIEKEKKKKEERAAHLAAREAAESVRKNMMQIGQFWSSIDREHLIIEIEQNSYDAVYKIITESEYYIESSKLNK